MFDYAENLSSHLLVKERVEVGTPPGSSCSFSVVTFNILVQHGCTDQQFTYMSRQTKDKHSRHSRIYQELELLNADIYCLQEVDNEPDLLQFFGKKYEIFYFSRTNEYLALSGKHAQRNDGIAVLFRKTKFRLICSSTINFNLLSTHLVPTSMFSQENSPPPSTLEIRSKSVQSITNPSCFFDRLSDTSQIVSPTRSEILKGLPEFMKCFVKDNFGVYFCLEILNSPQDFSSTAGCKARPTTKLPPGFANYVFNPPSVLLNSTASSSSSSPLSSSPIPPGSHPKLLFLTNTHLFWDPRLDRVKYEQFRMLLRGLSVFKALVRVELMKCLNDYSQLCSARQMAMDKEMGDGKGNICDERLENGTIEIDGDSSSIGTENDEKNKTNVTTEGVSQQKFPGNALQFQTPFSQTSSAPRQVSSHPTQAATQSIGKDFFFYDVGNVICGDLNSTTTSELYNFFAYNKVNRYQKIQIPLLWDYIFRDTIDDVAKLDKGKKENAGEQTLPAKAVPSPESSVIFVPTPTPSPSTSASASPMRVHKDFSIDQLFQLKKECLPFALSTLHRSTLQKILAFSTKDKDGTQQSSPSPLDLPSPLSANITPNSYSASQPPQLFDQFIAPPLVLPLRSAYRTVLGTEPQFTNFTLNFKATIDYIFFSSSEVELWDGYGMVKKKEKEQAMLNAEKNKEEANDGEYKYEYPEDEDLDETAREKEAGAGKSSEDPSASPSKKRNLSSSKSKSSSGGADASDPYVLLEDLSCRQFESPDLLFRPLPLFCSSVLAPPSVEAASRQVGLPSEFCGSDHISLRAVFWVGEEGESVKHRKQRLEEEWLKEHLPEEKDESGKHRQQQAMAQAQAQSQMMNQMAVGGGTEQMRMRPSAKPYHSVVQQQQQQQQQMELARQQKEDYEKQKKKEFHKEFTPKYSTQMIQTQPHSNLSGTNTFIPSQHPPVQTFQQQFHTSAPSPLLTTSPATLPLMPQIPQSSSPSPSQAQAQAPAPVPSSFNTQQLPQPQQYRQSLPHPPPYTFQPHQSHQLHPPLQSHPPLQPQLHPSYHQPLSQVQPAQRLPFPYHQSQHASTDAPMVNSFQRSQMAKPQQFPSAVPSPMASVSSPASPPVSHRQFGATDSSDSVSSFSAVHLPSPPLSLPVHLASNIPSSTSLTSAVTSSPIDSSASVQSSCPISAQDQIHQQSLYVKENGLTKVNDIVPDVGHS